MAVLIELLYQKVLVVEKIVAEIELPQWRTVTVEPPRGRTVTVELLRWRTVTVEPPRGEDCDC